MSFSEQFFTEVAEIAKTISKEKIESIVDALSLVRTRKGRLFVLGVGGSAGNASHAVNDFRKLCNIEAYAPTDNVSELTARTNDDGFETIFEAYLRTSNLDASDCLLIFSVGGGSEERKISLNLINAIKYAKQQHATVCGVVGKSTGYTALNGDHVVVVPELFPERVTPHSESFQAVVWHSIVSHPKLQSKKTTW